MGGRPKVYHDLDEILGHRTVQTWLKTLREGPSRMAAGYSFARYARWLRAGGSESDPDALIEQCLAGTNRTLIGHLQKAVEYCQGVEGSRGTRQKQFVNIKGFYGANMVMLPRTKLKNGDDTEVAVGSEVTATEFLAMARKALGSTASVRDRSIILTVISSGMDASTLANVFNVYGFPQLVKHFGMADWNDWDVETCPVKVDLVRPKSGHRYFTFLDTDAVEGLRSWLNVRPGKIRIHKPANPKLLPTSDPIYLLRDGNPLDPKTISDVFREAGKAAGVNSPPETKAIRFRGAGIRYPFHSHESRDVMVTLAKRVGADVDVANFLIGHVVDRLGYDKSAQDNPAYYKEMYLRISRPALNPISGLALQVKSETEGKASREVERLARQVALLTQRLNGISAYFKPTMEAEGIKEGDLDEFEPEA